jgi:site-specific recombinase XerD
MTGRVENEIKINNNIQVLLEDLPEYVSDYYYNIQVSNTPNTCRQYIRDIKNFLIYIDMDIASVNDAVLGKYLQSIKYAGGKKRSEEYVKKIYSCLNQFLQYLNNKNIIDDNPMKLIKRPSKKDHVERYYLDMKDLSKILESVIHDYGSQWQSRDYAILFILMVTGMRRTALSEINIEDIDFKAKEIKVVDKRDKLQIYVITDEMRDVLLEWIDERDRILKKMNKNSDALFISSRGERITDKLVYRVTQKYSEKALGRKVSPHKLRASFAVLYYEKSGHDIEATRDAMGHSDIAITGRYITKNNKARCDSANFMSSGLTKKN